MIGLKVLTLHLITLTSWSRMNKERFAVVSAVYFKVLVDFLQELLHPSTEVRGLHDSGAYQVGEPLGQAPGISVRTFFLTTPTTTPSATSATSE